MDVPIWPIALFLAAVAPFVASALVRAMAEQKRRSTEAIVRETLRKTDDKAQPYRES